MSETTLALLNTSIITSFGTYVFEPISTFEARDLIDHFRQPGKQIQSYIGHQPTAELLTRLFGFPVDVSNLNFRQEAGTRALVFCLNGRPSRTVELSVHEMVEVGYEFGMLTRTT